MDNTYSSFAIIEDNPYLELNIAERREFMDKVAIATQHGYFSKIAEVVNMAQSNGLYDRVKPISANNAEIKDLDNPIN